MSYGVIEYNLEGKPKCELCNKYFHRVLSHVRQVHSMSARDYKSTYGLDLIKGITSVQSKLKSRQAVFANYDTVVTQNLLDRGTSTRYQEGYKGRTVDQVSEQTRIRLSERMKTEHMINCAVQNGHNVGKLNLNKRHKLDEN